MSHPWRRHPTARASRRRQPAQQLPFCRVLIDAPLNAPYRVGMLGRAVRDVIVSPHALLVLLGWLALILTGCAAPVSVRMAESPVDLDFSRFKADAGLSAELDAPDLARLSSAPRWTQALPLYRQWMTRPLAAPLRVNILGEVLRAQAQSPHDLIITLSGLAGVEIARPVPPWMVIQDAAAADALLAQAWSAIWQQPGSDVAGNVALLPEIPVTLRAPLAQLLAALVEADRLQVLAFTDWPADMNPMLLVEQALVVGVQPFATPDYRLLLKNPDHSALYAAMQDLVATVAMVSAHLATLEPMSAWHWRADTPLGMVLVDTTGADNRHELTDALLVVDSGGDDGYRFDTTHRPRRGRVKALIDLRGNDRYVSAAPGADPSGAVMGVGVLIDLEGDDVHQAGHLAQGAALFGSALLFDGGGNDVFGAQGHAQGFALAGSAALVNPGGDDEYTALTHAQASAGPAGVAVLIDRAGDDRYLLDNQPLISPSAQSAEHNVSMGQGAARGVRADNSDGRSLAGGIAVLLDEAGDDHYRAQVFAQGAGFWEGAGVLLDWAGNDRYDGVWYVQGAAAHRAFGFLHDRSGDDHHQASHSTSLAAAHDLSNGFLINGGSHDHYRLGTLGLGAAQDGSLAVLADLSGDDRYTVIDPRCRALGAAVVSGWHDLRPWLANVGIFMDYAGNDHYPDVCPRARDDHRWHWPRTHPERQFPGESGMGWDVDGGSPAQ